MVSLAGDCIDAARSDRSEALQLPVNREDLPFDTCLEWQNQTVSIVGLPPAAIHRSFSWKRKGHDGWSWSGNEVLICPRCLRQWAHLDYGCPMAHDEPVGCLSPTGAFCGECGEGYSDVPAGSILYAGYNLLDLPLLYALPENLLRREFEIHLKHLMKELEE
jgi:hypothetical protein